MQPFKACAGKVAKVVSPFLSFERWTNRERHRIRGGKESPSTSNGGFQGWGDRVRVLEGSLGPLNHLPFHNNATSSVDYLDSIPGTSNFSRALQWVVIPGHKVKVGAKYCHCVCPSLTPQYKGWAGLKFSSLVFPTPQCAVSPYPGTFPGSMSSLLVGSRRRKARNTEHTYIPLFQCYFGTSIENLWWMKMDFWVSFVRLPIYQIGISGSMSTRESSICLVTAIESAK